MGLGADFTPEELASKFPPPPDMATLHDRLRTGDVVVWTASTELWHIYKRGGKHPANWNALRRFGPVDARFDHHEPPPHDQARGILYLATLLGTCLAEVFQATKIIDRGRDQPWAVAHTARRPVRLLDLTGAWPTRVGASMLINDGPRVLSRAWSTGHLRRISRRRRAPVRIVHVQHEPCIALYERGADSLPTRSRFNRALMEPVLLDALATVDDEIGYDLV